MLERAVVNNPYAPPHSHVVRPLAFPIPVATAPATRTPAVASRGRRVAVYVVGAAIALTLVGWVAVTPR